MGWLFGDRDDEYLDEDEKRLLRESEKRKKAEIAKIKAELKIDSDRYVKYSSSKPVVTTQPHEGCAADHDGEYTGGRRVADDDDGCKADHSDDYPSGRPVVVVRPAATQTSRPNAYGGYSKTTNNKTPQKNSKGLAFFVIVAIIMVATGMFGNFMSMGADIMNRMNETKKSQNSVTIKTSDSKDLEDEVIHCFTNENCSREEIIGELLKDGEFTRKEINNMIDELGLNFEEHAYIRLKYMDYENSTVRALTNELLDCGFTDEEIDAAFERLYKEINKESDTPYEEIIEDYEEEGAEVEGATVEGAEES